VDTNIPPQPSDRQLIEFFKANRATVSGGGTKSDRLSSNARAKSLAALKREHEINEVLAVSTKTEAGTKALWPRLMAVVE